MSSSKQMYDATMLCDDFCPQNRMVSSVHGDVHCLFAHVFEMCLKRIEDNTITYHSLSVCVYKDTFSHKTASLNHFFFKQKPTLMYETG